MFQSTKRTRKTKETLLEATKNRHLAAGRARLGPTPEQVHRERAVAQLGMVKLVVEKQTGMTQLACQSAGGKMPFVQVFSGCK